MGARIRGARERQGLTQQQLADAIDVGKGFVSYLESDAKLPSVPTLIMLADHLGVSTDHLCLGTPLVRRRTR